MTDEAVAERLLRRADKILAEIDEAYIIHARGHHPRAMPTFAAEEISLGKTLGTGGFGIVSEITKFTLNQPENDENNREESSRKYPLETPDNPQQATDGVHKTEIVCADGGDDHTVIEVKDDSPEEHSDHVHYDVDQARHLMERRCIRNGQPRYALKRLHGCLNAIERARGTIDLAVEAKILSVVWHPNIIKLRGIAEGNMIDRGFFIIMDRLFGTLDLKIIEWAKIEKKCKGGFFGIGRNKKTLHELMVERLTVAYDLAAAFFYLHENRLIYRDIKPENIGFDTRGDVKIFDFGLCKSLSPKLKAKDGGYGYRLTGRAGSLPYMAPEVVRMETYDSKCDVYSFAILLWEILSLRQAFKGMSPSRFVEKVVVEKGRLRVPKEWPPLTRLMMPEAWDDDPRKRPDMKRVAVLIRADLNDMTNDDFVLHRTMHMLNRSAHSFRGEEM